VAPAQCGSCGETIREGDEVQRQEREIATVLVACEPRLSSSSNVRWPAFRANEIDLTDGHLVDGIGSGWARDVAAAYGPVAEIWNMPGAGGTIVA